MCIRDRSGLRHSRKHLGWYLDRHAPETPDALRSAIMTGIDPPRVKHALAEALGGEVSAMSMEIAA